MNAAVLTSIIMLVSQVSDCESLTVSEAIRGTWEVYDGHWGDSEIWFVHIGTLEIDDTSYVFAADSNALISPQMSDRFSFINEPVGSLMLHYLSEIEPEQPLGSQTTLATCSFDQDEEFLITYDPQEQELFFHSQVSEIQLFRISKLSSALLPPSSALLSPPQPSSAPSAPSALLPFLLPNLPSNLHSNLHSNLLPYLLSP